MELLKIAWLLFWSLSYLPGTAFAHGGQQPWKKYVLSPATRSPSPVRVHSTLGQASVTRNGDDKWSLKMAKGSRITMDFGVEVGGHVAFDIISKTATPLSLAFAESPSFIRNISDDTGTTPFMNWDQALEVKLDAPRAHSPVRYRTPDERFRGGFRFLTLNAIEDVTVSDIICEIGFAPNMPDLRAGTGYFYTADDEDLNRFFFAGAYTVQTTIAPNDTGRFLPQVYPGWAYNSTLSIASPSLVDGAKRDRAIWPGDMGLCSPVVMMALGQFGREAVHNSLATLFFYQNMTTGLLPYAGPSTVSFQHGTKSDTYHAWGLITMYEYAMYSGDHDWLSNHWDDLALAVDYIVANINETVGLQNQTNQADWARGDTGGYNSALNALAYRVLTSFASLSPSPAQCQQWNLIAARLKTQYNALLWDADVGLYRDNLNSTLHPQDGNSMALLYGLPHNSSQRAAISAGLERNWNNIGPVTPELNDTISPFVSGIELLAHLQGAENPARAMKLLHLLWGYLLDGAPDLMTGSTFAEGVTANGSLYYRSEAGYDYDASYTSLSHAWSSAPSSALLTGVVGLTLNELGGKSWTLKPQLGELKTATAGFETGLGWFEVLVEVKDDITIDIELETPKGSRGTVIVPDGIDHVVINSVAYTGRKAVEVD